MISSTLISSIERECINPKLSLQMCVIQTPAPQKHSQTWDTSNQSSYFQKQSLKLSDPFPTTPLPKGSNPHSQRRYDLAEVMSNFWNKIVNSFNSTIEPPCSNMDPISLQRNGKGGGGTRIWALGESWCHHHVPSVSRDGWGVMVIQEPVSSQCWPKWCC